MTEEFLDELRMNWDEDGWLKMNDLLNWYYEYLVVECF